MPAEKSTDEALIVFLVNRFERKAQPPKAGEVAFFFDSEGRSYAVRVTSDHLIDAWKIAKGMP